MTSPSGLAWNALAAFLRGLCCSTHGGGIGHLSDEDWRLDVAHRLTSDFGDRASYPVEQWSRSYGYLDQEVLEVVRAQRRQRAVVLLTNSTTRSPQELAALGLLGEVDEIFNSADLGLAKPDPAVFVEVCSQLGLAPQRCAFVDDSVTSVEAARQVGLQTHQFREVTGLREFVNGLASRGSADGG